MSKMKWNVEQNRRYQRGDKLPPLAPWQEERILKLRRDEDRCVSEWLERVARPAVNQWTLNQLRENKNYLASKWPSPDDARVKVRKFEVLKREIDQRLGSVLRKAA